MNPHDRSRTLTMTILGEPASKANSRQLVRFGKRPAFIKSPKARAYAQSAAMQVTRAKPLMEGPLGVVIKIYYASERPDLDESVILDVLQGRVYKNDRQVRKKFVEHAIDRVNPRAHVTIYEL
jgi:hypothetical protein